MKIYLGNLDLGAGRQSQQIIELYQQELHGSDSDILIAQNKLRETGTPNFFGSGILPLDLIQKSLLTGAEYNNYTRE